MSSAKQTLLQSFLVILCGCFLVALPVLFTEPGAFYIKLLSTSFVFGIFLFLSYCCSLVLDKGALRGLAITGLSINFISLLFTFYIIWGIGTDGGFSSWRSLRNIRWDLLLISMMLSFNMAQVCVLMRMNPRTHAVSVLRMVIIGAISVGAFLQIISMAADMRSEFLTKLIYFAMLVNGFGTLITLIMHELSKGNDLPLLIHEEEEEDLGIFNRPAADPEA